MELCNGGNLDDLLHAKYGKIAPNIVKKIIYKLVRGLNDML